MDPRAYRSAIEADLKAQAAAPGVEQDPETSWPLALAILRDADAPTQFRLEALATLQAGTFLGARFDPFLPAYVSALTQIADGLDEESATLRRRASDMLSNIGATS